MLANGGYSDGATAELEDDAEPTGQRGSISVESSGRDSLRLESIPNFSEGRREGIVERLCRAASQDPGARLLDASSDADHHRCVLTLAGSPDPLVATLETLYEIAVDAIDLRHHSGVHPRIGAVDVVPFVTLADNTIESHAEEDHRNDYAPGDGRRSDQRRSDQRRSDEAHGDSLRATEAPRRLGHRVAERFEIPVFLYGESATHPSHRSLAALRRGGLDALTRRMARSELMPDYGPRRPHPSAGVTVIGSRFFLIAANAVLATDQITVARRIAADVRESSGGLPAVQALGLELRNRRRAQVSMNLLDFRRTGLAEVMSTVDALAMAAGTAIHEVEIIGLVPRRALPRRVRQDWAERGWIDEVTAQGRLLEPRLAAAREPEAD